MAPRRNRRRAASTARMMVLLPVPGPPVTIATGEVREVRIALRCNSE